MNSSSIFVSDTRAGTITKFHSDGSRATVATGLNSPAGIVLDGGGNLLFVANSGSGTILKYDLNGNSSVFVSNLSGPSGLALDRIGNLFVANQSAGTITKLDSNGNGSVFAQNLHFTVPYLVFDSAGNLYASTTRTVEKFAVSGAQSTVFTTDNVVYGVAFDGCGQRYIALQNSGKISGLPNGGGSSDPLHFFPAGLAFSERSAHLYVACGKTVMRYHLDGCGMDFALGFRSAQYLAVSE